MANKFKRLNYDIEELGVKYENVEGLSGVIANINTNISATLKKEVFIFENTLTTKTFEVDGYIVSVMVIDVATKEIVILKEQYNNVTTLNDEVTLTASSTPSNNLYVIISYN